MADDRAEVSGGVGRGERAAPVYVLPIWLDGDRAIVSRWIFSSARSERTIYSDRDQMLRHVFAIRSKRRILCIALQEDMSQAVSTSLLHDVAEKCEGFSGRMLRKLPFLAHAASDFRHGLCSTIEFCAALERAAKQESADRHSLTS